MASGIEAVSGVFVVEVAGVVGVVGLSKGRRMGLLLRLRTDDDFGLILFKIFLGLILLNIFLISKAGIRLWVASWSSSEDIWQGDSNLNTI